MGDVKVTVTTIEKGSGNIAKVAKSLEGLGTAADKAGIRQAALKAKQEQLARAVARGNLTVDQAADKYRNFANNLGTAGTEADKAGKKVVTFKDSIGTLATGIVGATGAIVAMGVAAKKAFDLAKEGAQITQLGESFDRMNASVFKTPDLLNRMREATRGTVSDAQLMSGLLTLTAGATDELAQAMAAASPRLLEIAKASNKLNPTLGDTAFLYQSLATGIKRSSPLILDNLGLVVKVGDANQKMADSLGKSVEELTATEKQMALLNEVLEAGGQLIEQVGGNVDSAADSYAALETAIKNVTDAQKESLALAVGPAVDRGAGYIQQINAINAAIESGIITTEEYYNLLGEAGSLRAGLLPLSQIPFTDEAIAKNEQMLETISQLEEKMLARAAAADKLGAADADLKFKTVELTDEQQELLEALRGSDDAASSQAVTNRQAARVMAAQEKAARELAERTGELRDQFDGAISPAQQLANAIKQIELDAFNRALEDSNDPIDFFNETLDELGPKMVAYGGRTADQNRILAEARDRYKDLDRAIVDYSIGLDGLGLTEAERSEKIGELVSQQQQLLPIIQDLESVQGSANMVIQEATLNEEALNRAIFEQVQALSDDKEQIALVAGALGLYNEQQVEAALKAAALAIAVDQAAQMIVAGDISAQNATRAIRDFASGQFESAEAALAHWKELEETNEQLDQIPGDYDANVQVRVSGLSRLREAVALARELSGGAVSQYEARAREEAFGGENPYRRHGGPVLGGNPYIVGEAGPELFVPRQSGTIVPNSQLNLGGMTINVNVSSGNPAVIGKEVAGAVASELGNRMRG